MKRFSVKLSKGSKQVVVEGALGWVWNLQETRAFELHMVLFSNSYNGKNFLIGTYIYDMSNQYQLNNLQGIPFGTKKLWNNDNV